MVIIDDAKNYDEMRPKIEQEPLLRKYAIPIQNLDYQYIETCTNPVELEKIVKILQSGEEGYYPDLTAVAERRLAEIKPKSKLLLQKTKVLERTSLPVDERRSIDGDLNEWLTTVGKSDQELVKHKKVKVGAALNVPEVRQAGSVTQPKPEVAKKAEKRIKATDYESWDKYDPDTELLKIDLQDETIKKRTVFAQQTKKPNRVKKSVQFKSYQTNIEQLHEANYEKEKGNEFFKVGDLDAALRHYTNSINCKPMLATYNNRALVHIKLENWEHALDDCNSALNHDPSNVKALVRKTQTLIGLKQNEAGLECIEKVIQIDPNNHYAQELAEKLRKSGKGANQLRNVRFSVQEYEGERFKPCERCQRMLVPIPGTSRMQPPFYIECDSDCNAMRVQNGAQKVIHLVSIDNSEEDDDCCTINHLSHRCTKLVKSEVKKSVAGKRNKNEAATTNLTDRFSEIEIKEEKCHRANKQIMEDDKRAGGEPYIETNEFIEMPEDIHSPYSFLTAWNSANADSSLETQATILKSIDMSRITNVIGCKMDNSMFSRIIECLCCHFAVPSEVERLFTILHHLVNLPRFDIIAMLISANDRKNLNQLINFLHQHGKPLRDDVTSRLLQN